MVHESSLMDVVLLFILEMGIGPEEYRSTFCCLHFPGWQDRVGIAPIHCFEHGVACDHLLPSKEGTDVRVPEMDKLSYWQLNINGNVQPDRNDKGTDRS